MRYGCENKVVGNRLCSGEELGDSLFLTVWETCGRMFLPQLYRRHIFEVDSRRQVTVRLYYESLPSVEAVC